MHFGCVELVEQHSSTRSTRRARLARLARLARQSRTCRVESSRAKWNLSLRQRGRTSSAAPGRSHFCRPAPTYSILLADNVQVWSCGIDRNLIAAPPKVPPGATALFALLCALLDRGHCSVHAATQMCSSKWILRRYKNQMCAVIMLPNTEEWLLTPNAAPGVRREGKERRLCRDEKERE